MCGLSPRACLHWASLELMLRVCADLRYGVGPGRPWERAARGQERGARDREGPALRPRWEGSAAPAVGRAGCHFVAWWPPFRAAQLSRGAVGGRGGALCSSPRGARGPAACEPGDAARGRAELPHPFFAQIRLEASPVGRTLRGSGRLERGRGKVFSQLRARGSCDPVCTVVTAMAAFCKCKSKCRAWLAVPLPVWLGDLTKVQKPRNPGGSCPTQGGVSAVLRAGG
jgi:hypothetical protein